MRIFIIFIVLMLSIGCGIERKDGSEQSGSKKMITADTTAVPKNAEVVLVASHDGNLEDYKHKALVMFKNQVESNSNGSIGIKIYPNGQLAGGVNERIDGLNQGSLDIVSTTGDVSQYWEALSIFDLPYMVDNDRLVESIFEDPSFMSDLRQGALKSMGNARLMVITNSGRWRNFATTKVEIKKASDLKGLKIRTVSSQVQQQLVTALGASPTSMAWADLPSALATNLVDGTKNGMVDIANAKLHESLRYVILDGHAYMAGYWWMNQQSFAKLNPEQQDIIVDAFDSLSWFIREYNKFAEVQAYEVFKANGGQIYKPSSDELSEFQRFSEPVYTWFKESASAETLEWLDRYKLVIEKHRKALFARREQEKK